MPQNDNPLGFESISSDVNLFATFHDNKGDIKTDPVDDVPEPPTPKSDASLQTVVKAEEDQYDDEIASLIKDFNESGKGEPPIKPAGEPTPKNDQKPDETQNEETDPVKLIYQDMVTKKIFDNYDGFDGSDESLEAAISHTVQNRLLDGVEEYIDEAFSKVPAQAPIAKAFIAHLAKGGSISSFQQHYSTEDIDETKLDPANSEAKEQALKVINTFYTGNGLKPEAVAEMLKPYEALGDEAVINLGKTLAGQVKQTQRQQREQEEKRLEESLKTQNEQRQAFNLQVKETIENAEEVLGEKMTKEEREAFVKYVFVPTELVNGKKLSKFQVDQQRLNNDPKYTVAKAFLAMKDLKVGSGIVKKAEQAVTATLATKLRDLQNKKQTPNQGAGASTKKSILADLDFDNMDVVVMNRK